MKSLKGSQTEKNILTAFAGESQARNRYDYFAGRAKNDGFVLVQEIFVETALQEKEHAKRLFKFLEGGDVEITAAYPAGVIADSEANLIAAASGENHEHTVMLNYILENKLYFKDYVEKYTNAAFVVGKDYAFNDGLFSGYDPATRTYDKKTWVLEMGPDGKPVVDPTFQNERCVINMMRQHYSRYTLKNVSDVTGVSQENLLKVYKAFCATGGPDKAGTIM